MGFLLLTASPVFIAICVFGIYPLLVAKGIKETVTAKPQPPVKTNKQLADEYKATWIKGQMPTAYQYRRYQHILKNGL